MKKIDYDKGYKECIERNIAELRESIDTKDMLFKIKNYCERYDLPFKFVRHKILTDNIFALNFTKDPGRQTFHQHYAAEFISALHSVVNFKELPSSGKNALYILEDGTIAQNPPRSQIETIKSIDFYWEVVRTDGTIAKIYASHKYTKISGGSQDHQANELKETMKHAMAITDPDTYFLAICDGDYYQNKQPGTTRTKQEHMNDVFGSDHGKAITTNEIEAFLEELK